MANIERRIKKILLEGVDAITSENESLPIVRKKLAPFREIVGGFEKHDRPKNSILDKLYSLHDEIFYDISRSESGANRYSALRMKNRMKRLYGMVKDSLTRFDLKRVGKERSYLDRMLDAADKQIKAAERKIAIGTADFGEIIGTLDVGLSFLHEVIDILAHFFGKKYEG